MAQHLRFVASFALVTSAATPWPLPRQPDSFQLLELPVSAAHLRWSQPSAHPAKHGLRSSSCRHRSPASRSPCSGGAMGAGPFRRAQAQAQATPYGRTHP